MSNRNSSLALAAEQRRTRVLDAVSGPTHAQREHDLRNLLYVITSFTQLLTDGLAGAVTPRQKELLGHVLDCSRDMRQLLDASRRDAAQLPASGAAQPAAANS